MAGGSALRFDLELSKEGDAILQRNDVTGNYPVVALFISLREMELRP